MVKLGCADNLDAKVRKVCGEYPELDSRINCLYQDKKFPTRAQFNKAYDDHYFNKIDTKLKREKQLVIVTPEDLTQFKHEVSEGEFEEEFIKVFEKIEKLFQRQKIRFLL
jgi:hypothetical protein